MREFFRRIGSGFTKAFAWLNGPGKHSIETIMDIAQQALPVVEFIASLTPTRVDDEIIALFKVYGLPMAKAQSWLQFAQSERGGALLEAATAELRRRFPGLPDHVLQTAIQLAVVALKQQNASDNPAASERN